MKIIIVNGSYRKKGSTAIILNEIYENLLRHPNVEVEMIDVANLQLDFCIGCCSCYKTGTCILEDGENGIESLSRRIEKADGIILGSPTYASNVSAQMKLLIDRGHFVLEQLLHKKYALSVVTYENYGGKDTSKVLNKLCLFSGAQISGRIISKIEFNKNPLEHKKIKKEILRKTEILYRDIKHKRIHYMQRILHAFIFYIGIRPFVIKKGARYRGVVKHWNE